MGHDTLAEFKSSRGLPSDHMLTKQEMIDFLRAAYEERQRLKALKPATPENRAAARFSEDRKPTEAIVQDAASHNGRTFSTQLRVLR